MLKNVIFMILFVPLGLSCAGGFGGMCLAAEKDFTIDQAAEFALQYNGDLRALREERGVREAGQIRAGLYPNPVLEMDGTSGQFSGSPNESRLGVAVSQEFLTAGKMRKRLDVADNDLKSFARQIGNAERVLRETIRIAFFDVLLAERRVELSDRVIGLSKQLLEITRQRFALGDIPEMEVSLAEVEVARSEEKRVDTERGFASARTRICSLMGLSGGEDAGFRGALTGEVSFTKGLEEIKRAALLNRPDFLALEAERQKSAAEIALAEALRIPNVTGGVGYMQENKSYDFSGTETKSRDSLLGLKVSIPIPVFDRNQAGIKEARARQGSAERRYAFARQTIEREVEGAYRKLAASEKSLGLYRKNIIPQLEVNLKLVQTAYRLGELGILAVIEEQRKFFEVSDGYLNALYNRQTAFVRLEAAVAADLGDKGSGGEQ